MRRVEEVSAEFERKQKITFAKKVLKQFETKLARIIKNELSGDKPGAVFIMTNKEQMLGAGLSDLDAWSKYEKSINDSDSFQTTFLKGEFKRKNATRNARTEFEIHDIGGVAQLEQMPDLIVSMNFLQQVHMLIDDALSGANIGSSEYKQTLKLPTNPRKLTVVNIGIESTGNLFTCDFSRFSEEKKLLNRYESLADETKNQICCMLSNFFAREFNLFELRC